MWLGITVGGEGSFMKGLVGFQPPPFAHNVLNRVLSIPNAWNHGLRHR